MQTKGTSKKEKRKEKNASKENFSCLSPACQFPSLLIPPWIIRLSGLKAFRGRQSQIGKCRSGRRHCGPEHSFCVRALAGAEGIMGGKKGDSLHQVLIKLLYILRIWVRFLGVRKGRQNRKREKILVALMVLGWSWRYRSGFMLFNKCINRYRNKYLCQYICVYVHTRMYVSIYSLALKGHKAVPFQ